MVKAFTRLYIRQFGRLLRELGLWRRIFLLLLVIMLFMVLISKVNSHSPFIAIAAFVSLLTLHFQRKDRQFLKIVNIDEKLLFFVHYHLLALPLYLIFGLFLQLIPFLLLFTSISLIPLLSSSTPFSGYIFSFRSLNLLQLLPLNNFEFVSGLRKHKIYLLVLYGLALVFFQYPMVAFCTIIVFTFMSTSFYNESEPWIMLEVYQLPPRKFLLQKIKSHLSAFWVLCLPLILLFLFHQVEYWYVMLVLMVVSSVIQALSICLKYTFYEPGKNFDNSIFMAIYGLSLLVIFFIPVPFVMLVYYFRKATLNLNHYLYDYH